MAIFHCVFIERNLRRKWVLHSIFIIVAVLGCGHSCLSAFCSCIFLSVTGLGSGSACSGREGGRINADRRFSSGWIPVGWRVSIAFHSLTVHLPLSHSSCTCPLVNSMRYFSFADLQGAVECWLCIARCLLSRPFTASGSLRKVCIVLVCSWNSTTSGLGSGKCLVLPSSSRRPLLCQPVPILHVQLDRSGNEGRHSFVPADCFQC